MRRVCPATFSSRTHRGFLLLKSFACLRRFMKLSGRKSMRLSFLPASRHLDGAHCLCRSCFRRRPCYTGPSMQPPAHTSVAYAEVAAKPRYTCPILQRHAPIPARPPTRVEMSPNPWRTADNRPMCFAYGMPGHVGCFLLSPCPTT